MRSDDVRNAIGEHYDQTGEPARLRDISERTGIPKSSVHRWTIKLWQAGEIDRIPSTHGSITPHGKCSHKLS